jgi:hypothetical protein
MLFTVSMPNTFSISFPLVAAPSTGVIRSRAFAMISSRVIGLSGVPRTAPTLAESLPIGERHFHDRLTPRHKALEFLIANQLHFRALAKNRTPQSR